MNIRYRVELPESEREGLLKLTASGRAGARKVKRTPILLMADQGAHPGELIEKALNVSRSKLYRVKKKWVEVGLEEALAERSRPEMPSATRGPTCMRL